MAARKPMEPLTETASEPAFEMQQNIPIVVSRGNPGSESQFVLATSTPKYKDNPYSEPAALTVGSQAGDTAYRE